MLVKKKFSSSSPMLAYK